MNIETFREYCLSFNDTTEGFPFDDNTLVFKINNKMFSLTDVNNFTSINLKCDPEKAIDLRERYDAVQPGYHMNKKHWNTILMNNSITDKLLFDWIKESYELVAFAVKKRK